jgi:hypothetical protein
MKRKARRIVQQPIKLREKILKRSDHFDDGLGTSVPPEFEVVHVYFDQKGQVEFAHKFFEEQEMVQWKTQSGQIIRNWKEYAAEWIYNRRQDMKRRFRQSPFFNESF